MRGWQRPIVALVALITGAACATRGPEETVRPEPGEVPGMLGRSCRLSHPRAATPSLTELTRLGFRGSVALWGREMEPADTVQLSVRYAEDGQLLWVQTMRSTVPPERAAALERLFRESLDTREQADWGVRILVAAGDIAGIEPSVICDAEGQSNRVVRPSREALQYFHLVRGHRFPVRIALDDRGNILDVQLLRRTNIRPIDQYILDYVWNSSFRPKLHDGIGVASTLETTIEFSSRAW